MADETLRYDILVNAKAAIQELREMSKAAADNNQRVVEFSSFLIEKSKQWNVPLKQLLNTFKQINAELAKSKGQSIFGNVGGQNIFNMSESFLQSAQAAGRFQSSTDGVVSSVKNIGNAMEDADKKGKGWKHGIDLIRTALGTLTAVGIFQFLSFITESFQTAVKAARELEEGLYRLHNAERILSQQGIDIKTENLEKGIQDIKKLLPVFSEEDLTGLVGQVSIQLSEKGLSEKEILGLAKAIAVLNVNSVDTETLAQTAQGVIGSLLTDNAKGVSKLGIELGDAAIEAKAFEMNLLAAGESSKDLTASEKDMVKLQLIIQKAAESEAGLGEYLESNSARIQQNEASWHDLLASIGSIFTALTPLLTPFFDTIKDGVNGFKAMLVIIQATENAVKELVANFLGARDALRSGLIDPEEYFGRIREIFTTGFQSDFKEGLSDITKFFPKMPANAPDWFKNLFGEFLANKDTITAPIDNFQNALDSIDTEKARDALEDMLKKLEDLQNKMKESEEDFQLKLGRFDQDTLREREDMVEDYNLNVLQTQRQFALRRKEAEDKYRQREIQDERRFQEQMRQLREKFLYNLEDALRERDARQVLRLIDQYNMERQALINENALRKKDQAEQQQQERDQLKAEEAERLRVMAEEFALKMQRYDEESAIKRQRMEEDHAIEMARLKEQQAEIIEAAAYKIAEEYGLNEQGAQALYNLLNQYYGSSGALATLTANGYNSMLMQASTFLSQIATVIAQYQGMMAGAAASISPYSSPGGGYIPGGYSSPQNTTPMGGRIIPGYAEGGQFVATKPRVIAVGEGGESELVTITPLSQLGSMRNIQPVNGMNGMDGRNGQTQITLDMNLSPDLEARVVRKSMDGTAAVIERINRSKR